MVEIADVKWHHIQTIFLFPSRMPHSTERPSRPVYQPLASSNHMLSKRAGFRDVKSYDLLPIPSPITPPAEEKNNKKRKKKIIITYVCSPHSRIPFSLSHSAYLSGPFKRNNRRNLLLSARPCPRSFYIPVRYTHAGRVFLFLFQIVV